MLSTTESNNSAGSKRTGRRDFETAVREDVEKAPIMGERMGLLGKQQAQRPAHRLRLAALQNRKEARRLEHREGQ